MTHNNSTKAQNNESVSQIICKDLNIQQTPEKKTFVNEYDLENDFSPEFQHYQPLRRNLKAENKTVELINDTHKNNTTLQNSESIFQFSCKDIKVKNTPDSKKCESVYDLDNHFSPEFQQYQSLRKLKRENQDTKIENNSPNNSTFVQNIESVSQDINLQKTLENNKLVSEYDLDKDFSPEYQRYQPLKKKLKAENNNTEIKKDLYSFSHQSNEVSTSVTSKTNCNEVHGINDLSEQKIIESTYDSDSILKNACVTKKNSFELSDDESNKIKKIQYLNKNREFGIAVTNQCQNTVPTSNECFLNDDSSSLDANHEKFFKNSSASESNADSAIKSRPSVVYIYSDELHKKTNTLIRIENRAELVHSLIRIYGLLQYIKVVQPRPATDSEIVGFHCPDYISCLRRFDEFTDSEDISDSLSNDAEEYGLSYDCPPQTGVFETASLISGASITAAEELLNQSADIAINWYGGWHHAKRDAASGFCYINDIVLSILKLREKYDQVLYVDLDLHHGDGVEEAFELTSKVMTVSFHKYEAGFFPGSGHLSSVGSGKGKFYSVNVPLKDGIRDAEFFAVFRRVMKMVKDKFSCEALVVQCGADSLSEDPMASFNLTHIGLAKCVCFLLSWKLPTLLLGGGGYNFKNTAKTWTFLTGIAAGKKLPIDIPEHEHLLEYGPSYELTTSVGNRKDCNSTEYLKQILAGVQKNLNCIG